MTMLISPDFRTPCGPEEEKRRRPIPRHQVVDIGGVIKLWVSSDFVNHRRLGRTTNLPKCPRRGHSWPDNLTSDGIWLKCLHSVLNWWWNRHAEFGADLYTIRFDWVDHVESIHFFRKIDWIDSDIDGLDGFWHGRHDCQNMKGENDR